MFDKFPELYTERLDLVEITQSHLIDFYEIFRNEKATKYYISFLSKKKKKHRSILTGSNPGIKKD